MKKLALLTALLCANSALLADDIIILKRTVTVNLAYNDQDNVADVGLRPFRARQAETQYEIINLTAGSEEYQIVEYFPNYNKTVDPQGPARAFFVSDVVPGLPYTVIPTAPAGTSVWVSSLAESEQLAFDSSDVPDGIEDYFATIQDVEVAQGRAGTVKVTRTKSIANVPSRITISGDGMEQFQEDVESTTGVAVRSAKGAAVLDKKLTAAVHATPGTSDTMANALQLVKNALGSSYVELAD